MSSIRVIINPKAGNSHFAAKRQRVIKWLKSNCPDAEVCFTERKGHGSELAKDAVEKNIKRVVAVGGDGSVNEIAKVLTGTTCELGIIPMGSGNGIARHFAIPMNIEKALHRACSGTSIKMDTCIMNGHPFFMLAGVGFDAFVAKKFNESVSRGLSTYALLSASSYFKFGEKKFTINIDENIIETEAFLVVVANCTQFGNNVQIAPGAKADDGLLNISVLKKAPLHQAAMLAWQLISGNLQKSRYVQMYEGRNIKITQEGSDCQLDGEYLTCGKDLEFRINPLSLNLIGGIYD